MGARTTVRHQESYLTNFGDLNLGGIMTLGKLVNFQIDTSSGTRAFYDTNFISKGFHLTFDLTIAKLWRLILGRIQFLVTPLLDERWCGLALIWIWRQPSLIFRPERRALWNGGNLNSFLWAIFSLYNLGKEKNGMGKKWGTFEILTMWKHKTNTKLV